MLKWWVTHASSLLSLRWQIDVRALAATGRYCKDSTSIHLHCAALPSPPHYSQLFPFAYLPVSCFSTRGGRDFVNYFLFMVSFLRFKS
ncbi:hypothetical protein SDJN02_08718, partial [Cucurbita argyrosperma subsp. argyrosperma]